MENLRLKGLRKEIGLTQKELSEAIDISQSMIARIENGDREPRKEVKIKIAKYFNVTVEWLFYEQLNDQQSLQHLSNCEAF